MAVGLYALDAGRVTAVRGLILEGAVGVTSTLVWHDLSSPRGTNRVLLPTQIAGAASFNVAIEGTFSGTTTIYGSLADVQPAASPLGLFNVLGVAVGGPGNVAIRDPWRWIAAGFDGTGVVTRVDVYGVLTSSP